MLKTVVFFMVALVNASAFAAPVLQSDDPFGRGTEMVGPGVLKSSVYFLPTEKDKPAYTACAIKKSIVDIKNNLIAKTCPAFYNALVMEGSGMVSHQGKWILVNYGGRKAGRYFFAQVDRTRCPYGLGRSMTCLIPFISLAAETKRYRVGDVIYVPAVAAKKIKLPNGDIHRGYFIVTDTGSMIKGLGRFDVYIGPYKVFNADNPFNNLKLGDAAMKYPYFRVERGSKTEREIHKHYIGREMVQPAGR